LTNQLRRACISVSSNIAEGASLSSDKDSGRFLEITIGSCYEIEAQLPIASDIGYIKEPELNILLNKLESIVKVTSKFKSTLNK
jgi:four helix bundle protein